MRPNKYGRLEAVPTKPKGTNKKVKKKEEQKSASHKSKNYEQDKDDLLILYKDFDKMLKDATLLRALKEKWDAADGNAQAAIGLLLVDKIPELAKIQAEAIKNIKGSTKGWKE